GETQFPRKERARNERTNIMKGLGETQFPRKERARNERENIKKDELNRAIAELEETMAGAHFWDDKDEAQRVIKKHRELKEEVAGVGKYDKGSAVMTIFSGAGGDDSEDFSRMLYEMYAKYAAERRWSMTLIHKNENDHGGFRNITLQIDGTGAYGELKNESGVHRLVRISPFNAKKLRHTSFSMVEVIPLFAETREEEIPESDMRIEFAKSSGPGGQNVNKRETAVRIVHISTNLSVHVDSERTQERNKAKAVAILSGKLFKLREDERMEKEKGMYVSKTTDIEWGNQIRSYVLHPYKMVKDHRTGVEVRDVDAVLGGDLEKFIEAEKNL
ncbi:PCRF domain-containing protein, partial [bacterium]|nr:PCRF domain-containing protein [bacterium]